MNFVIENPPFGTPWSGKDAKDGQEKAVRDEFAKGINKSRWGIGLPSGGDSQLIFLQSALDKMDKDVGRAAIIQNGSPLFSGGVSSGESQIRKWLLENDKIEAIIALPVDLFYNTGISTYVWILSNNKRKDRIGKIQLIDASSIYHKLRKALGNKKNELTKEDREQIVKLYTDFKENEFVKIYNNNEFIYKEWTILQPLQKSYSISEERLKVIESEGGLSISKSDLNSQEKKYIKTNNDIEIFKDTLLKTLYNSESKKIYYDKEEFVDYLTVVFKDTTSNNKIFDKISEKLGVMDKKANIQKDKKGNILYDKDTKDTENVKIDDNVEEYMKKEVLPYVPDAKWFFEEDLTKKKPIIKTGAEIPFTRYFYKYKEPEKSEKLIKVFNDLESKIQKELKDLFD
jgi:type I restriction enzyme M protein